MMMVVEVEHVHVV